MLSFFAPLLGVFLIWMAVVLVVGFVWCVTTFVRDLRAALTEVSLLAIAFAGLYGPVLLYMPLKAAGYEPGQSFYLASCALVSALLVKTLGNDFPVPAAYHHPRERRGFVIGVRLGLALAVGAGWSALGSGDGGALSLALMLGPSLAIGAVLLTEGQRAGALTEA